MLPNCGHKRAPIMITGVCYCPQSKIHVFKKIWYVCTLHRSSSISLCARLGVCFLADSGINIKKAVISISHLPNSNEIGRFFFGNFNKTLGDKKIGQIDFHYCPILMISALFLTNNENDNVALKK